MKVSKNWLSEYLDLSKESDEELYQVISSHICEIESYHKMVEATHLTIGKVLDCQMHPNSDHLHICQVEVRPNEVVQIVCGAPNVQAGKKVIVANVGAVLPNDFKIKSSKIRGVESNGMLCSLQELGIEEKYVEEEFKNGIYLFPDDAVVGEDPLKYLDFDDTIIDLDVTSNRSDLLSVEGVAYDLGAALHRKITTLLPTVKESQKVNPVQVRIETKDCYQYHARYIHNVKIQPSPQWLKAKLIKSGIRPINNVVDITNYILLEFGQPLHAFDADRLSNQIVVRNAYENETLVTLDGIERKLLPTDVVIANEQEALCVAGVMGGLSSEVEPTTQNIVLEAAVFSPMSIRKTSARLGLKSESSMRFERKVDEDRVLRALDYAAQMVEELAGGEVYRQIAGMTCQKAEPKEVTVTTEKINHVLGTALTDEEVRRIFDDLQYSYVQKQKEYVITIPTRRMDLEASDQDIIEDVARMNGYDRIPTTIASISEKGGYTFKQKRIRAIRNIFASLGMNETVTYSLISKKDLGLYVEQVKPEVAVLMPMTEDHAVMRQSLLNGVLDAVSYNRARKVENLAFFEIGNVYTSEEETLHLAGALSGILHSQLWKGVKVVSDFYVLKGLLEVFFEKMNVTVTYEPYRKIQTFHPERTARIFVGGTPIGFLGELHPRYAKEKGLSGCVAFEMDLTPFLIEKNRFEYRPLNKYPTVSRDLAIVVAKEVPSDQVLEVIRTSARKNLVSVELFDVYMGENIGENEKSLAVTLTFEDTTRTLESAEVDQMVHSILKKLDDRFHAKLRN